jgi:hypothetical protein
MTTLKKPALRKQLETVAKNYIRKFELAHGAEFDFAVGDDLIGVLCFGDNYFSFADIVYDIDNKLAVGLIFEWQNAQTHAHLKGSEQKINLQSYAMGARFDAISKKQA